MKITEIPAKPKEQRKIRVAAYARVSSDKDAAFHSLEAQRDYYEAYVAAHPDWELVGLYSDNGITGTTINRPEFKRMLEDCREGKVDLVITKSVTRFARNTVILLETVRELKGLGVDCYFEKEDMHSISPDGELLLTLLAMYAEEGARSASENQKWRVRRKFENGEPWVGDMLGYRLVEGELRIVPEEAEIVRKIFKMYLSGLGMSKIASELTREGVHARLGNHWPKNTIRGILKNEKYTGDMILQKTYNVDFRTKAKKVNKGERRQYYVENSHDEIISKEVFEAVQQEEERRRKKYKPLHTNHSNTVHLFTGMIQCGLCEQSYIYRQINRGKYNQAVYQCNGFETLGKSYCPSQKIPEPILIEKTKEVLGVAELNREILQNQVKLILVPEHNHLVYYLSNGEIVDVPWKHRSRSESWTPEMRQAARERSRARARKENR